MVSTLQFDHQALVQACEELGLRLVLAFGSRTAGRPPPRPESDLDLALLDDLPADVGRFSEIHGRLAPVFRAYDVDLSMLASADPLFRLEIFRTAVLLYGSDDEFFEQKAYAYKAYADSSDLRRLEERLCQKKMAYIRSVLNAAP